MNHLTLAVAGGGKTQSIVDACFRVDAPDPHRSLALTFTRTGQQELAQRLRRGFTSRSAPIVSGWFSFLLSNFVRPYLCMRFKDRRLGGFNFDGDPGRYATGVNRFLDPLSRAYRLHLAQLAINVLESSNGAVIDRLERRYTDILIDEIQDLAGWDLEVLDALLASRVKVRMVGDLRQSLLETNPREPKNKRFRGLEMLTWFRAREGDSLTIEHQAETWRSNQEIAAFADSIFESKWGFPVTKSRQLTTTDHDGVFAVDSDDATEYVRRYSPQCLRVSRASAKAVGFDFRNFGDVKGLTFPRVLIYPTAAISKFLTSGQNLSGRAACGFYVGVTRAKHSVAIALGTAEADKSGLTRWRP